MDTQTQFIAEWRGFHHIALVTPDLDATIRFYGDVLGMKVGTIIGGEAQRGRHCFIQPGETEAWGLHFFEYLEAELFAEVGFTDRFAFMRGALQHMAFRLPNEVAAGKLRDHLAKQEVEVSPINEFGPIRNFLFTDNNGLLLEATWDKE
jgi:catechol 2,3-dioxygenase-like lactoylglutathione lyase family enzyme